MQYSVNVTTLPPLGGTKRGCQKCAVKSEEKTFSCDDRILVPQTFEWKMSTFLERL